MLAKSNIFPVAVGDRFSLATGDLYLVYSPLAEAMLMATPDSLQSLENAMNARTGIEAEVQAALDELLEQEPAMRRLGRVKSPGDLQKMSVLPTHRCNLSCSYCYSSAGRGGQMLSREKLKAALDYFIDALRLQDRCLDISFIGGGEPLLAWEIVRFGIEYASALASKGGFKLAMTLVTNGTIMNDEIAGGLMEYGVLPDISFDILEAVHEKNRGKYREVCRTLDMLARSGLKPSVNATVTPDNVRMQEQMVGEMIHRHPAVGTMVFEPVVSREVFGGIEEFRQFYNDFLLHFTRAVNLAKESGKSVTCRIFRNIGEIIDRGCPSKFALTPDGTISICYCSSSPEEKSFARRIYGIVDDQGAVRLDEDRFRAVNLENVHSFEKCKDCFAKWHCGGGCMCPNDTYEEPWLDVICDFTREMVLGALLERIRTERVMEAFNGFRSSPE